MADPTKDVKPGQGNSRAGSDATSFFDGHPTSNVVAERLDGPEILEVLEETLSVSKHQVVKGKVRVSTRTETHEEIAEVALDRDVVDVKRVPMNTVVAAAPEIRTEGDTTIVPVLEERLVVTKQLVLVEELHIRRRVEHEVVRTPVSLRRQHVEVEHLDGEGHPIS